MNARDRKLYCEALEREVKARRLIGARFANFLFNTTQRPGYTLRALDCERLAADVRAWDRIERARPTTADEVLAEKGDSK